MPANGNDPVGNPPYRGGTEIPIWVIYDSPRDLPGHYVARLWHGEEATGVVLVATLDQLRRFMRFKGLYCIGREANDDPCIVEAWL